MSTKNNDILRLKRMHRLFPILLMLGVLTLSACSWALRGQAFFGGEFDVNITIAENANRDNPVAVDLILIYNEELVAKLLNLPAQEWFKKRDQFKQDFPRDTGFDSWEWEWVPNQHVSPLSLPMKTSVKAVIIFANYGTEGDHRARVIPNTNIQLEFLEEGFRVESPGIF
jgi:type VI secretion system protein